MVQAKIVPNNWFSCPECGRLIHGTDSFLLHFCSNHSGLMYKFQDLLRCLRENNIKVEDFAQMLEQVNAGFP